MTRTIAILRTLGLVGLVIYFVLAAGYLSLRYVVLPNASAFQPIIQQRLSEALHMRVQLEQVSGDMKGLNPGLTLQDVDILDEQGRKVLHLPRLSVRIDWRSLFGTVRFHSVGAQGLEIDIRRDENQQIWLLGQALGTEEGDGGPEIGLEHPFAQWLAQLPEFVLTNATIRWVDEARSPDALELNDVRMTYMSRSGGHDLAIQAVPADGLARLFHMQAQFEHINDTLPRSDPTAWDGMFYLDVQDLAPRAWSRWVDMPQNLQSGQVSAQWWLAFQKGAPDRFVSVIQTQDGLWRLAPEADIQLQEARLSTWGPWDGVANLFTAIDAMSAGHTAPAMHPDAALELALEARGLRLRAPQWFRHELDFKEVQLQTGLSPGSGPIPVVSLQHFRVINDDLDLQLAGGWDSSGSGPAGTVDLKGIFKRMALPALDRYMPVIVNPDAIEWMNAGLVKGQLRNVSVMLKGDLEHFPFASRPEAGDFRLLGDFSDVAIDYMPEQEGEPGWPALVDMKGRASLDRAELRIHAQEASMRPTSDTSIRLSDVLALIPDIEEGEEIHIEGQTNAAAASYLALARHTPLQEILDGMLDDAQATGNWRLPLRLHIPFENADDTRVRGEVVFEGGSVKLTSRAPLLGQVQGALMFTESGLAAKGLKAQLLGGPVSATGGVGGKWRGLRLEGRAHAEALQRYVGLEGLERMQGRFNYVGQLTRSSNGNYSMLLNSSLEGLAMDLPSPLGKPADSSLPLKARWQQEKDGSTRLDINLGASAKASLLRGGVNKATGPSQPYFTAGVVAINRPAALPAQGLDVDARYSSIDLDAWDDMVTAFAKPLATKRKPAGEDVVKSKTAVEGAVPSEAESASLFPDLRQVRLQADELLVQGLKLDQAIVVAHHRAPSHWAVDVDSTRTAGSLVWREATEQRAGRVQAHFTRLALGSPSTEVEEGADQSGTETKEKGGDGEAEQVSDVLDIPAIDLQVDAFTLYDMPLGSLSVEGVNESRGQRWRLNQLSIQGPGLALSGAGLWRLSGAERGLVLDARADASDLGRYMHHMGIRDVLEAGQGTMAGQIEWRNMPWKFKRSDLNGRVEVKLDKGRFSTVNSRSARILELLSLQSLQRIATFQFNPGSVFKEGFPFDSLTGTLHLNSGILTTSDYRVVGPVGTINIGGDVNLVDETLKLQATVLPNLDMSGASIAAGIAINPVVGLGAFLTQWLLRAPLAKAMRVQYEVSGSLSDPQLKELSAAEIKAEKSQPQNGRAEQQSLPQVGATPESEQKRSQAQAKDPGSVRNQVDQTPSETAAKSPPQRQRQDRTPTFAP